MLLDFNQSPYMDIPSYPQHYFYLIPFSTEKFCVQLFFSWIFWSKESLHISQADIIFTERTNPQLRGKLNAFSLSLRENQGRKLIFDHSCFMRGIKHLYINSYLIWITLANGHYYPWLTAKTLMISGYQTKSPHQKWWNWSLSSVLMNLNLLLPLHL